MLGDWAKGGVKPWQASHPGVGNLDIRSRGIFFVFKEHSPGENRKW